jgi:leader peptidase (prepilin peptidase)/N-methyltransferase
VVIFWLAVSVVLIQAFLIDLRHKIIPNGSNLFLFVAGVIWTVFLFVMYSNQRVGLGSFMGAYAQLWQWDNILVNHIFGMVVAGLFFLLIVLISRGKGMGMGDVKLIGALGLLFGFPDIILVIVCSFIVGTIAVIPLLLTHKKRGKDAIPFGPFIVLASFLVLFWGSGLLRLYFGIIETLGGSM